MPTLDATPGGAGSNSYTTLAEAESYFTERLGSIVWDDTFNEADKRAALITATRRLDALRYVGYKTTDTQALVWPRIGAFDESGYEYDTTVVPEPVKQATYETALRLLAGSGSARESDPLADSELAPFDRAKVGPLEVDINHNYKPSSMPDAALRAIRHLLRSHGMMATMERS